MINDVLADTVPCGSFLNDTALFGSPFPVSGEDVAIQQNKSKNACSLVSKTINFDTQAPNLPDKEVLCSGMLMECSDYPLTPIPAKSSLVFPSKTDSSTVKRQNSDSSQVKTVAPSPFTPNPSGKQRGGPRNMSQVPKASNSPLCCSPPAVNAVETPVTVIMHNVGRNSTSSTTKNDISATGKPVPSPKLHTGPLGL